MEETNIRWTDSTWNPMSGCSKISPGCKFCYADIIATRFEGTKGYPNGFKPTFKPHKLSLPRTWKEPRRIFVNSMSDLFHEDFTDEQIDRVFGVMVTESRHTHQVLTKRDDRMLDYVTKWLARTNREEVPAHIWLGVSVENDDYTYRVGRLRSIRCPVRFVSVEPLLGPVPSLDLSGMAWVIVGGESGQTHRKMDDEWARSVLAKARATAGVKFFFKQHSGKKSEEEPFLDGVRYDEMPEWRKVPEQPTTDPGQSRLF